MTALEDLARDPEAGAVTDIAVAVKAPSRLAGWAAVADSRRWAYLACHLPGGEALAHAVANRFNAEAFARRIGFGWVGFALDLAPAWARARGRTIAGVCLRSGARVFEYDVPDVPLAEPPHPAPPGATVAGFLRARAEAPPGFAFDQFDLYCEDFVAREGAEIFVRRAYAYLLEREADPPGLATYLDALAKGVPPHAVLRALHASPERKAKPPGALAMPGDPAFPFDAGPDLTG